MGKLGLLLIIIILLPLVIGAPLALIWALNTLGLTSVGYNFYTWLAAFLIWVMFSTDINTSD